MTLPFADSRRRQSPTWVLALVALVVLAAKVTHADEPEKPLPPEQVTLRTGDGLTLLATFYPSREGKKAVPVVLLHASKGSHADFEELALLLQQAGHAVIAPDLRGHGETARAERGERIVELRPADYAAMADEDVEAVKKFLLLRNNAGELNIDKLCLVGVEMGADVAINFAARDWSWPVLNTGKQGQDVKALVLISPEWTFKGLRIGDAIADENVRSRISVLVIAGRGNSKAYQEARRLYTAMERFHPNNSEDEPEKQTLVLRTPATSLQGTRLLHEKSMKLDAMIAKFIELRLVRQPIPWTERRNPLE